MKLSSFIVCLWAATTVSAYGLYGGYERALFYYAYLLDRQFASQLPPADRPRMICPNLPDRPNGQPATLEDFVNYINIEGANGANHVPAGTTIVPNGGAEPYPDRIAFNLRNMQLTGDYDPRQIMPGLDIPPNANQHAREEALPTLFRQIGVRLEALGTINGAGGSERMKRAQKAGKSIWEYRGESNTRSFKRYLMDSLGIDLKTTTTTGRNNAQYTVPDWEATDFGNRDSYTLQDNFNAEDGARHNNIRNAVGDLTYNLQTAAGVDHDQCGL